MPAIEQHPLRMHIQKITPLTDKEFEYVLSHFVLKKYKKHQFLVQSGGEVAYDYWIMNGLARSYFTDLNGKEYILQFGMEEWWISDYQAYFNNEVAKLDIDCIEDCEVLALSLVNREKLCADLHQIGHFFRKKSNSGYVGLQRRLLALLTTNAQERYNQLLNQYPKLFQRVPKQLIAAYLGVSRETLSRFSK
jgi:CRP-like cAMP-binding protein